MNWTSQSARKPIIFRRPMVSSRSGRLPPAALKTLLRFALPLTLGLVFLAQLAIVPSSSHVYSDQGTRMTNDTLRVNITQPKLETMEHCQQKQICGFLTVSDRGRLGNMMSQYATLYAYARKFNMKAVISSTMSQTLRRVFPHLSIPTVKPNLYNWTIMSVDDLNAVENIEKFRQMNVWIGGFPAELPIFDAYRNSLSLTAEFKLEKLTEGAAKGFLQKAKSVAKSQITVGVHVRRTDYSVWLEKKVNGRLLSKLYFQKAMDYFRDKYSNVIFILASDDKTWTREMFKDASDVVFTPRKPGEQSVVFDLAVLSLCNHSITSFGTFSFWSAYLRPATSEASEVIVADGYYGQPPLLLRYIKETRLPSWQFLADPCYRPLTPSMAKRKPLLTKECEAHKQDYGIN